MKLKNIKAKKYELECGPPTMNHIILTSYNKSKNTGQSQKFDN